ncbi:MAG: hypothetical protein QG635_6, partial [Bacteroidota bacterium]|nr:hypothetical protein [Bacteroidota bacterium]
MRYKRFLLLVLFYCLITEGLNAQQSSASAEQTISIIGTVRSSMTQNPIPGVTISVI